MNEMRLLHRDLAELDEAIRKAFQPRDFKDMLHYRLDRKLVDLTGAEKYPHIVYDVLEIAGDEGWMKPLLEALRDERKDREDFCRVIDGLLVRFEKEPKPAKHAAEEILTSRAPIVIAVEETDDPIESKDLLQVERHVTVKLDPEQVSQMEALGQQLINAESTDAFLTHGSEAWRILKMAEFRLSDLLDSVAVSQRDEKNQQPVAWTGKAALLCRIYRAILAASRDDKQGVDALVSVGFGAHYFHPLGLSERLPTMARRQSDPSRADIEIERVEFPESDDADEDMLPKIAGAVVAECVLVGAKELGRPFRHLAELVGRHEHSATRLAIGFGDIELSQEFLTTVLASLPAVSFAGPTLLQEGCIEEISTKAPTLLPRQAVAVALSWLRNDALRQAFEDSDVAKYRDALFWTVWSRVGRPLFASQFGEVTPACYPHIMDLRSVAKKAWYCPRHEGISSTYHAEKLVGLCRDPEGSFHLYLTGAGGTGKSCYLRNVFETLEDNQPSVLPVWYKVDAPSSTWKNVEERVKEETVKALERRLGKDDAQHFVDTKKDLRFFLTDLVENLKRENAPIEELVLFVDQLERTFESGDNPDPTRLARISKEFISLLAHVGVAKGIRLFIASRKQYLPDFLTSFENAQKRNLHFCVLQEIQHETEQIEFAQTVLTWCRDQKLVHGNLDLDEGACKELAQNVGGHPLKLMLALIRILSQGGDRQIGADDLEEMKPKPWEDLFFIDELLAAKDELDWYFFLAMAHARTEIVRFSEVWWRLRLVTPELTERADNLGRKGVLERLWLLGHLGRTVYPRPLGTDEAGFLEFFHANLRDHFVTTVMNYGGEERLQGRRGGMPPAWRALDRLTAAARDWKQSQQLTLREDIEVLMKQKEVFVESINVDRKTQKEAFYLLFMRDAEENREELFDCAKECFVYSALVHDVLGRWAFKELYRNVPERVELCQEWLRRSDRDSRIKILQYLVELRRGEANDALCELVFRPAGSGLGEVWQQLANILAEPLFARRFRAAFMVAAVKHLLRSDIEFPDASWQTARFGKFCTAACNGRRDELIGLIRQMAEDVASLQDADLQSAVTRLLTGEELVEEWLQDSDAAGIDLTVASREIHGYIPPRIELRVGDELLDALTEDVAGDWHRRVTEELGLPLPAMVLSSGEVTGELTNESVEPDSDDPGSPDSDSDDQNAFKLSLLIDGRVIGVGDFYPGQVQTLRRHWTLADRTLPEGCQRSHNEALGECVVWLPQNEINGKEFKVAVTPFEEAVLGWLAELLRQNVAEVFTLQELMPLISTVLDQRDPRLNVNDFLRIVSGNEVVLWQVLVNLARERVPLHGQLEDLMVELQEVVNQTGQTNTVLLTQRLREYARHALCRTFADQTNQLPVMLFGEATEGKLIERLGVDQGKPAFALKPEEAVELAAGISGQFETVVQTEGSTPVLVCEEELRAPLFRMIQHFDSRIHVLSYTELSEDVQPRSCGLISGLPIETGQ